MINVIIADHQAIFRAGIAKVLAVEEDIRVAGLPQSYEQLLNVLEKLRARVLILATSFLPQLEEILEIAGRQQIAVLMLAENTENASDFMRMGVQGVLYRSASGNVVLEALRRLSRGQVYLHSPHSGDSDMSDDLVGTRVRDRLTDRELRIIAAVVQGYKNRDIAMQLYTTEQMVKNCMRNIFDKIGVSDRLELALFVLHHRILNQATATIASPLTPRQRITQTDEPRPSPPPRTTSVQ